MLCSFLHSGLNTFLVRFIPRYLMFSDIILILHTDPVSRDFVENTY